MGELSIKQNIAWNTAGSLFYLGSQWLTTVLVVVLMPTYEGSGALAFAMAMGNVYVILATYNVRTFQVSDVKNEFSSGSYVGFRLVTVAMAYAVCAAYSIAASPTASTMLVVLAFLLFKADEAFVGVLYGMDQKAMRMDYIGISQVLRGIVTLVAFGGVLYLTGNLPIAVLTMFCGCVLVTLLYDLGRSRRLDEVRPSFAFSVFLSLARRCLPVVLASFLYCLVATIARQWFGIRFGEEALGVYAAVATPCALVQSLVSFLYAPFITPLAQNWEEGGDGFRQLLLKVFRNIVVVSVACLLAAVLLGRQAVELVYGASIEQSSWLIVPAMVAASLMALDSFLTDVFIVIRKFSYAVIVNALAVAVCVASMNALYDAFYSNGVNLALILSFAISVLVGAVMLSATVRRRAASLEYRT